MTGPQHPPKLKPKVGWAPKSMAALANVYSNLSGPDSALRRTSDRQKGPLVTCCALSVSSPSGKATTWWDVDPGSSELANVRATD